MEKVGVHNWRHVESHDNPADLASRGCTQMELLNCELWWHVPKRLRFEQEQWPKTKKPFTTTMEIKPVKTFAIMTQEDILERFSSLLKAIRVVAYLFRFYTIASRRRREYQYLSQEITPSEFKATRIKLFIITQKKKHFPEEYDALTRKNQMPTKSSLLTLNPSMNSTKIMRVDGRLSNPAAL